MSGWLENALNVMIDDGSFKGTPFMIACHKRHTEIVTLFLEHSKGDIDLNVKDNCGRTSFYWACKNNYTSLLKRSKQYLHQPKNPEQVQKNELGYNPVQIAVRWKITKKVI